MSGTLSNSPQTIFEIWFFTVLEKSEHTRFPGRRAKFGPSGADAAEKACNDCLHHGGGVTTTDALFVGVPVLTLEGPTPPSRNGATLAHAIGAPEMITHSFDEYEQLALRLINDRDELDALRVKLLRNAETWPIFDVERLTRHLEIAYDMMWDNHAAGNPPTHLQVPALPKAYT